MAILEKLFKLQSEINRIKKDSKNEHFKNTYADLNAIMDEVKPYLDKHKILYVAYNRVTASDRNISVTKLIDQDDNTDITSELVIPDGQNGQKLKSDNTYFKRIQLENILGLQTVDDDGQAGSNPIAEKSDATEEQILTIEGLFGGDDNYRKEWLDFMGVASLEKASKAQLEKAISEIKKQQKGK